MTRIDSRGLAVAFTALLAVAPAARAEIQIAGYKCTEHTQIGKGGLDGLIGTLKFEQEISFGGQSCAKACSETKGCVGISVKEVWENGKEVTYCQMYSKIVGTSPYPIGADGKASWGYACLNISRVKWRLPKPGDEVYTAKPQFPPFGDPNGASAQDANRPGGDAPAGGRRR